MDLEAYFLYKFLFFFAKNVLVLKTLLIFAQKIYISYQEIYKSVHVKAKHNKLKNRRFPLIKSSC